MSDAEQVRAGKIDQTAVDRFWQQYKSAASAAEDLAYVEAFQFGDDCELADQLLDLVVHGPKRATAGSLAEYEADGARLPSEGDLWVVCDGEGTPRAVIQTTEVRIGALSSVDDQFAWDEGEGDRTRDDWLRGHTEYFTRSHARLGVEMDAAIPVVFERFELLYPQG